MSDTSHNVCVSPCPHCGAPGRLITEADHDTGDFWAKYECSNCYASTGLQRANLNNHQQQKLAIARAKMRWNQRAPQMKTCTTHHHACDCREKRFQDAETLLAKWLVFSADVTPGDATGAEWLASLREKTMQFINPNTSPEIVRKYQSGN